MECIFGVYDRVDTMERWRWEGEHFALEYKNFLPDSTIISISCHSVLRYLNNIHSGFLYHNWTASLQMLLSFHMYNTSQVWPYLILFHPISSHLVPSHPILSYFIPSYPISSHFLSNRRRLLISSLISSLILAIVPTPP